MLSMILMLCVISFLASSCHYEPSLYPVKDVLHPSEDVKIIAITEDGNVLVNEAFILWVEDLKLEIIRLRKELEKCKEEEW